MRLIFTCTAAAVVLAGCDLKPVDNRASDNKPVVTTPTAGERQIKASFDCGVARGQAQELICADANLAAMDREVAQLAGLAVEPAAQANWAMDRDECWKADQLRECVMAASALQIHRLRQGSDVARSRDAEGISVGPVAYRCTGIATPVSATFINSDPGAVALEWAGQSLALDHVEAASGARYEGRWEGRLALLDQRQGGQSHRSRQG